MTARENAARWIQYDVDEKFREGIQALLNGPGPELEDAFYKDLEFGTGGMRGVMGVGSNRVNRYTFGMATQGMANYLHKAFAQEQLKAAIAYDCRHNSKEFARLVAGILSANNIQVYLFEDLRPTPELSFAVRRLRCHTGIVITASHNPPAYNGYKVYWNDGAQIVSPHDKGIIEEVRKVNGPDDVRFEANDRLIEVIGREMDQAFIDASILQRKCKTTNENLKIVLTSLHGTSITLLPTLLKQAGYTQVSIVDEQAVPDGDFPTVKSPNPEEREALAMALALAEKENADVVIGTDPDGDRLGVAVRNNAGEMMLLNGNQCGVILTDYLLSHSTENEKFIAYTIVSSDLFARIAQKHNSRAEVCLTGFKHIAALIRKHEDEWKFIGGGEESYGYMVGDFVRDKDAMTSSLIFCDWLGGVLSEGRSAEDALTDIYREHHLYVEQLLSITREGISGVREIEGIMQGLRNNPPVMLGGERVTQVYDYLEGIRRGSEGSERLPASNVLEFRTEQGSRISARPSGTEPKIKFYFSVNRPWIEGKSLEEQQNALKESIERIVKDLDPG